MKVSFICPIYNKLKFLPMVTKGIFNQIGSFDKEYIFIDDGSQDGSLDEIKRLTKKSVKIVSIKIIKDQPFQHKKEFNLQKAII